MHFFIFGEKLIALNNSQEWWDEADFDVFFMELQKELELRIPDKYYKKRDHALTFKIYPMEGYRRI